MPLPGQFCKLIPAAFYGVSRWVRGSEVEGVGYTEEGETRFLPQGVCVSGVFRLNLPITAQKRGHGSGKWDCLGRVGSERIFVFFNSMHISAPIHVT